MSQRVTFCRKVKSIKRCSRSESESEEGEEWQDVDPKPCDLCMIRLKER